MVLLFKDDAIRKAGMTPQHAEAFQQVADESLCIIMCRSVNLACTGLIAEGYASKGFKVKAKSCDWGPAAGFIAADPRFSKKGSAISAKIEQAIELNNAYTDYKEGLKKSPSFYPSNDPKDALVPLYLSAERVKYLRSMDSKSFKVTFEDKDHIYCEGSPPSDPNFLVRFVLKKEAQGWAVYYADGQTVQRYVGEGKGNVYASYEKEFKDYYDSREAGVKAESKAGLKALKEKFDVDAAGLKGFEEALEKLKKKFDVDAAKIQGPEKALEGLKKKIEVDAAKIKDFEQIISKGDIRVMGVANPPYIESHQGEKNFGLKRAVTGDYDLFAIIALGSETVKLAERTKIEEASPTKFKFYEHEGFDKRPILIGARTNAQLAKEDKYLGNITQRINLLKNSLNEEMQTRDGVKGRNMVHHSDEAGRPFDPELEYPIIAVVPRTLMQFMSKGQPQQLQYAIETLKGNTIFAVENPNDLASFFAAVQSKFVVMVNTSWIHPLEKAFNQGEASMKCKVPKWEEHLFASVTLESSAPTTPAPTPALSK